MRKSWDHSTKKKNYNVKETKSDLQTCGQQNIIIIKKEIIIKLRNFWYFFYLIRIFSLCKRKYE